MKKLMIAAFASAVAMVFSAVAGIQVDWFNGGIGADWPNDETMTGGAWKAATASDPTDLYAGYTAEKGIELDAGDDQLQFTNGLQRVLGVGTEKATCVSEMQLYPFTAVPDSVESGAKAGLILVTTDSSTYVYGVRKQAEAEANEWFKLSDTAVDAEKMATVTITAEKSGANALSISYTYVFNNGEEDVTVGPVAATVYVAGDDALTLTKASYTGSGFVKSLEATAVSETKNFTINAESMAEAHVVATVKSGATGPVEGVYTVAYGETVVITYTATDGYVLPDGTDRNYAYGDVPAVFTKDNVPGDVQPEQGKAHIKGGKWYLTLNDAITAALAMDEDGQTVVLDASDAGPGYYFQSLSATKTITIDYNGFDYTFTTDYLGDAEKAQSGRVLDVRKGNSVTFTNGNWKISDAIAKRETNPIREYIRDYGNYVELSKISLDASNLTNKYNGIVMVTHLNGDLKFVDGTSVIKPEDTTVTDFRLFQTGDYTDGTTYNIKTVTLDTTGTLAGDLYFFGGKVEKSANTVLPASTKYYYGSVKATQFATNQVMSFGFKAMTGTLPAIPEAGELEVGGQLYFSVENALAGVANPVSLIRDVELEDNLAVASDKTLDLNGLNLTIPSGKTLTLNGTLKCDATGSNYINLGSMLLSSTSVVYMGDVKMFGTTDGKFSIASGTVTQTAIDGNPLTGMQYTISANGAAAMTGDFPLWTEDPKVYMNNKFYLDTGATFTLSADASEDQAAICILAKNDTDEIKKNGYVYTASVKPTGTVFTVAATSGLTFKVDGAETAVEGPVSTVAKSAGDSITIEIVYDTATIKKPVRNGTLGNLEIVNSNFIDGVYTYTVSGNETVTEFTFTVADAKDSDKVQPSDLIPEDTDPTVASKATAAIDTLAKDSGESASPNTERVQKIASWMEKNSKVTAAAIAGADSQDLEDAFLLNCDEITDEKIEAAKAEFMFPSIKPGEAPNIKHYEDGYYNGTVTVKGAYTVTATGDDWHQVTPGSTDSYKFYKAELTK